jgi:DNA adenine methylase
MFTKTMSIKSPALKYYGSKFRLADWIISHFPKHRHYVEPFGGGANVLLLKERSPLETYNDLNHEIVTFFRVLRDRPGELVKRLRLTPWSRAEFAVCCNGPEPKDDVERARRLYYRLWMSIEGGIAKGSFRRHKNGRRNVTRDIRLGNLYRAARRLKSVVIEERDANKLIAEMDSKETLYYLDPPYIASTRTATKVYSHEMTDKAHLEFMDLIRSLKGMVILSGYPSPLYANHLENKGWQRVDKRAIVNSGGSRIESLWLSPNLSK